MRVALSCFLWLSLLSAALAAPPLPGADRENWANLLAGDYTVVGRKPDSQALYTGRLTLRARGGKLAFVRTVAGRTDRGTATFDTVAGMDRIPVLRMRLVLDGKPCAGIYQWKFDYDNYARFTGYVYREDTRAAGLEAWFPVPPSVRD